MLLEPILSGRFVASLCLWIVVIKAVAGGGLLLAVYLDDVNSFNSFLIWYIREALLSGSAFIPKAADSRLFGAAQ